ncbi:MAG: ATP-binding protein [Bacteroidales bacterium]|nr:ATP-binding protein [Bacteroidales bacterium]
MKIAIASGKGGTGKTTLATNLAAYLSEETDIVLADLDVEEPNSGLFIRGEKIIGEIKYKMIPGWVEENCTFCGICQDVCNFNAVLNLGTQILIYPELCHSCYACSELCPTGALPMKKERMGVLSHYKNGKIDFVESRLDIGQEQAVPLIEQTLKYIDSTFPGKSLVLLDSPPGTSCPVIEATKNADIVILVSEPTPFGLHDLKLAVETMKVLGKDFVVVVNRHGTGNAGVEDYCRENNIRIIASIADSRQVAELYSSGELVYDRIDDFRVSLGRIKDYLLEKK